GHSVIASRVAGAFRRAGRVGIADEIVKTMKGAGYNVRETDPFESGLSLTHINVGTPPIVGRIQALWETARPAVLEIFPKSPGVPENPDLYLSSVDEIYKSDAYHSLSIEGYSVTPELIERVRSGNWNPDENASDLAN